jgi:hypothetical protein
LEDASGFISGSECFVEVWNEAYAGEGRRAGERMLGHLLRSLLHSSEMILLLGPLLVASIIIAVVITRKYKMTRVPVARLSFSLFHAYIMLLLPIVVSLAASIGCGPGFVASSVEDIVKALIVAVSGECLDLQVCYEYFLLTLLLPPLPRSMSPFSSFEPLSVVSKVSSNAVVALGQDKKYFRQDF